MESLKLNRQSKCKINKITHSDRYCYEHRCLKSARINITEIKIQEHFAFNLFVMIQIKFGNSKSHYFYIIY